MRKKIQKLAKTLISLTERKSREEKEKIVRDFLSILKEKGKIHFCFQILRELREMERKKEVKLYLAKKIGPVKEKELKEKIKKIFGPEKKIKIEIDENLIGGFLAESENLLIDASLKGLINKIYGIIRAS